jgi:hypothetical protein
VDVWANPAQMALFDELAATFTQWRLERQDMDGSIRVSFTR